MIPLNGIVEIVGESGVGKSLFALSLCKYFINDDELNTVYLSHNIIKFKNIPKNVMLKKINSLTDLIICLKAEILNFRIKLLIIDDLEDYLYLYKTPRKYSNEIFQIIRILKKLYFFNNINIVIINESYKINNTITDIEIKNFYFGLPWEYLINMRYIVKKVDGYRIIEQENGSISYRFMIDDYGAYIVSV